MASKHIDKLSKATSTATKTSESNIAKFPITFITGNKYKIEEFHWMLEDFDKDVTFFQKKDPAAGVTLRDKFDFRIRNMDVDEI